MSAANERVAEKVNVRRTKKAAAIKQTKQTRRPRRDSRRTVVALAMHVAIVHTRVGVATRSAKIDETAAAGHFVVVWVFAVRVVSPRFECDSKREPLKRKRGTRGPGWSVCESRLAGKIDAGCAR